MQTVTGISPYQVSEQCQTKLLDVIDERLDVFHQLHCLVNCNPLILFNREYLIPGQKYIRQFVYNDSYKLNTVESTVKWI